MADANCRKGCVLLKEKYPVFAGRYSSIQFSRIAGEMQEKVMGFQRRRVVFWRRRERWKYFAVEAILLQSY